MARVKLEDIHYEVTDRRDETVVILEGISLDAKKGQFHVITGPSGSGKTTLLQLIGTILHPTKGTRIICSKEIVDSRSSDLYAVRSQIGYLFQTPFLPTDLKAGEFIVLQAELAGIGARTAHKRTDKLLETFGMLDFKKQPIAKLSGGEKQRVALASILIREIDLLLLDEPTGSLDEDNKKIIWELLRQIQDDNLTTIAVTHDRTFCQYADFVHALDYGKLKESVIND